MKKFKNLVFLPSSDELRADLYKLGLDFLLVRIKGQLHFMVVTNQMGLSLELAKKHSIEVFYASDSHRQIFTVLPNFKSIEFCGYEVKHKKGSGLKLGQLKRSESGNPFLVVQEDNTTYHYIVE